MDDHDVDAEFEAIIAGWESAPPARDAPASAEDAPAGTADPAADPAPGSAADPAPDPAPDPTRDGADRPDGGSGGPSAPRGGYDAILGWGVNPPLPRPTAPPPAPDDPGTPAPTGWRTGPAAPDDDDEHFVPEPVSLPPQEDLHFWGIVAGLVLGPLLLLWVVFVGGGTYGSWWLFLSVMLTLAGFGLLILRQPSHRDPEDDDNGARL